MADLSVMICTRTVLHKLVAALKDAHGPIVTLSAANDTSSKMVTFTLFCADDVAFFDAVVIGRRFSGVGKGKKIGLLW